jgi:hypothetical protein
MTKTRKEWNEIYNKLESKYNPYPVQMSRAEVFCQGENRGFNYR